MMALALAFLHLQQFCPSLSLVFSPPAIQQAQACFLKAGKKPRKYGRHLPKSDLFCQYRQNNPTYLLNITDWCYIMLKGYSKNLPLRSNWLPTTNETSMVWFIAPVCSYLYCCSSAASYSLSVYLTEPNDHCSHHLLRAHTVRYAHSLPAWPTVYNAARLTENAAQKTTMFTSHCTCGCMLDLRDVRGEERK